MWSPRHSGYVRVVPYLTNPAVGYINMQPSAEDLYHYVVTNGPMPLRQAARSRERS